MVLLNFFSKNLRRAETDILWCVESGSEDPEEEACARGEHGVSHQEVRILEERVVEVLAQLLAVLWYRDSHPTPPTSTTNRPPQKPAPAAHTRPQQARP